MPGISAKPTNWESTGWLRDVGAPVESQGVNFIPWSSQLGLLGFAVTGAQQRAREGGRAQPGTGAQSRAGWAAQQQQQHPHCLHHLSPSVPLPRHHPHPFVPSFYSTLRGAGSKTQKRGSAALLDLAWTERLPGGKVKWNPWDWTTFPFKHMEIKH